MALTGNNIELLVKLGVNNGESKANLNAEIEKLQKQLKEVKIDIKIDPQAIKSLNQLATMDFSKLVQSANEVKKGMEGIGRSAQKPADEVKKVFKEMPSTIDAAFKNVGKHLTTEIKSGIRGVDELKRAFRGMDATFTEGYSKVGDSGAKKLDTMTVSYQNMHRQMEKVKMMQISIDNGTKNPDVVWVPSGTSQVIDKVNSSINRLASESQKNLQQLRNDGKLTEKQFNELWAASNKAANGSNGKAMESNYSILNQRIQAAVQSTKQQTEAMKATEAAQKRLIENENKRKNLLIDIERNIRTQGKAFDTQGAQNLLRQTQQLDASSKNFGQTIAANRTALRGMTSDASTASRDSMGIISSFKVAMEKFPIWLASSTIIFGGIRTAREFMSIIVDIDSKMVSLTKVMSEDTDFEGLFVSATEAAERFGQSISQVMDSYVEFAKQGYKGDELAGLADAGLVASNVGEITAQQASEYMTASLTQWKMDAKDAMGIIDSWNNISNNYAKFWHL